MGTTRGAHLVVEVTVSWSTSDASADTGRPSRRDDVGHGGTSVGEARAWNVRRSRRTVRTNFPARYGAAVRGGWVRSCRSCSTMSDTTESPPRTALQAEGVAPLSQHHYLAMVLLKDCVSRDLRARHGKHVCGTRRRMRAVRRRSEGHRFSPRLDPLRQRDQAVSRPSDVSERRPTTLTSHPEPPGQTEFDLTDTRSAAGHDTTTTSDPDWLGPGQVEPSVTP